MSAHVNNHGIVREASNKTPYGYIDLNHPKLLAIRLKHGRAAAKAANKKTIPSETAARLLDESTELELAKRQLAINTMLANLESETRLSGCTKAFEQECCDRRMEPFAFVHFKKMAIFGGLANTSTLYEDTVHNGFSATVDAIPYFRRYKQFFEDEEHQEVLSRRVFQRRGRVWKGEILSFEETEDEHFRWLQIQTPDVMFDEERALLVERSVEDVEDKQIDRYSLRTILALLPAHHLRPDVVMEDAETPLAGSDGGEDYLTTIQENAMTDPGQGTRSATKGRKAAANGVQPQKVVKRKYTNRKEQDASIQRLRERLAEFDKFADSQSGEYQSKFFGARPQRRKTKAAGSNDNSSAGHESSQPQPVVEESTPGLSDDDAEISEEE